MYRVYGALIEIAASAVFILPIFFVYGKFVLNNMKNTVIYIVFAFYLVAVWSLVGFPNVISMNIDFTVNIIPFINILSDFKNALLNVILFVPMGIFLPILSEKFRKIKNTLLLALCVTFVIEIMQILTFRITDINDIITNMAGTLLGYLLAKLITKNFTKYVIQFAKATGVYITYVTVILIMFFVQPFISSMIWELVI